MGTPSAIIVRVQGSRASTLPTRPRPRWFNIPYHPERLESPPSRFQFADNGTTTSREILSVRNRACWTSPPPVSDFLGAFAAWSTSACHAQYGFILATEPPPRRFRNYRRRRSVRRVTRTDWKEEVHCDRSYRSSIDGNYSYAISIFYMLTRATRTFRV